MILKMFARLRLCSLMFGVLLMVAQVSNPAQAQTTPHIFGHLSNFGAQLSADGKWLLHVQRHARRTSVIVSHADGSGEFVIVKPEENRAVYFATWAVAENRVLISASIPGSGVEELYSYDVASGRRVDLLATLKAPELLYASAGSRDNLAFPIALYRDNEESIQHSLFQLDLHGGKLKPINKDGEIMPFSFAACPAQPFGLQLSGDGGVTYFLKQRASWHALRRIDAEARALGSALVSCSEAKREIYFLDVESRDFLSLNTIDLDTQQSKHLSADQGDIVNILFNRENGELESYTLEFEKPEVKTTSVSGEALRRRIAAYFPDDFELVSRSTDGKTYLVLGAMKGRVEGYYLWSEISPDKLTALFSARADMAGWQMQPQRAQVLRARDGETLTAYLTMPASMCPPQGCKTVVVVHSGPGERDSVRADPMLQWLSANGYMALTLNFRGSHGLGKHFEALGNREWGAKMQDDVDDVVRWAIDHGLSDSTRIAIIGNAYGGFAALNAVTREGNGYACAASMSGMTDLAAFVAQRTRAMPETETDLHARIGNPDDAGERRAMLANSPISRAITLKAPVLITAVENDPLMPLADALAFENKLEDSGKASLFSLFVYKGTGHVFNNEKNEQTSWRLLGRFLSGCLDGKVSSLQGAVDADDFERKVDGLHLLN